MTRVGGKSKTFGGSDNRQTSNQKLESRTKHMAVIIQSEPGSEEKRHVVIKLETRGRDRDRATGNDLIRT